ncbi:hypothetical protein [Labrys sp. WJW]|uniref:hypothetical protein n=1 Tax=Labrys sp. WJW TaxID=1737983 RepID=UPI0012EADAC2|nr:hypothetical protein [Labrys sp. WJW]
MAKVAETANQGISEAHTPAAPGAGDVEAALADLFGLELQQLEGATIAPPKKGPGRPPGSPNRTTLQYAKLMAAKGYRNPLEFLCAIFSMDVKELCARTGLKLSDAFNSQIRAAAEALPYFEQAMPKAVEVKAETARPLIIIQDGSVRLGEAVRRPDGAMSIHDLDPQQYQEVSEPAPQGSHDKVSHDER